MENIESTEQPRKRIGEVLAEHLRQVEIEREQETAFAALDYEPKHTPAYPGSSFGKRVAARIVAGQ